MKTAVSVLQEMMVKLGKIPEYECVAQSGLQHQASFEYRCSVLGLAGGGTARSKKEAKQEAAASMLRQLAAAGHSVPAPYADPQPGGAGCAGGGGGAAAGDARSYLALLKELCEDYRLPGPEYREVGEPTGPPHARRFEAEAAVGRHARRAASGTKRAARQLAAEALYRYLREHLRGTRDFVEEDALVRSHAKAMDRYVELREDTWRPDLSQSLADYHKGLLTNVEPEKLQECSAAVSGAADAAAALEAAATALGLGVSYSRLGALWVAELAPAAPALALAGCTQDAAARQALQYLELLLDSPPTA